MDPTCHSLDIFIYVECPKVLVALVQKQTQAEKQIMLKIPKSLDERVVKEEVDRLIERVYGYARIDAVRKRLKIRKLKKHVYTKGDEKILEQTRESAKRRVAVA